jgi:hypothetical protein
MMYSSKVVAFIIVVALVSCVGSAVAGGSVSDYLKDGWDIKAVTQQSSVGYTQIVLQKGTAGVICTIFYSAKEGRWTRVGLEGCDSLP